MADRYYRCEACGSTLEAGQIQDHNRTKHNGGNPNRTFLSGFTTNDANAAASYAGRSSAEYMAARNAAGSGGSSTTRTTAIPSVFQDEINAAQQQARYQEQQASEQRRAYASAINAQRTADYQAQVPSRGSLAQVPSGQSPSANYFGGSLAQVPDGQIAPANYGRTDTSSGPAGQRGTSDSRIYASGIDQFQQTSGSSGGGGSSSGGGGGTISSPEGWSASMYLKKYPDVANEPNKGGRTAEQYALYHYNKYGKNEGRQGNFIPAGFDEQAYLSANPDVAAAVRSGEQSSGLSHYLKYGGAEGRNGDFSGAARDRELESIIDNMIAQNDASGDGKLTEEELGNRVWMQYSDEARADGKITKQEAIDLVRQRTVSGYVSSESGQIGRQKQAIRALMGHELSNQVYTVQEVQDKLGTKLPDWIAHDGKVSDTELATFINNQVNNGNLKYTSSGSVTLTEQGRREIALVPPPPAADRTVSVPEAPVAATPEPEPSDTNRKPDQQDKKKQPVGEGKIEDPEDMAKPGVLPYNPEKDNARNRDDKEPFWTGGSIEAAIENHFGDSLKNGGFIPTHEAQEELSKLGITLPGSVAANGKLTEKKLAGFIRDEVKAGRMDFTPEGGLRPHDAGAGSSAGTGTVSNSPAVPVVEYDSDGDGEADVVGIDRDGDGVPEKGGPIQPKNESNNNEQGATTTEGDQKPMGSESVAQRPVESDDTPGGATLADQTATGGGGKVYVAKGGSITKMIQDLAAQDGKKLTGHEAWKIYENMKDEFSKMDVTYRMKNGQIGLSNPGEMRVDNHIVDKIRTLSGGEGALQASRIGDNNSGLKTLGQDSGPMGLAGNSQVRNNSSGSSGLPSMP